MESKKIMVGGPYYHADEEIKQSRLLTIKNYCLELFKNGNFPVSPLLMRLSVAEVGEFPNDADAWVNYCKAQLKGSDEFHVLCLKDWELSSGLRYEIIMATELGIPIVYVYS